MMTTDDLIMSLFYGLRLLPDQGEAWYCACGTWGHVQAKKCASCGAPRPG